MHKEIDVMYYSSLGIIAINNALKSENRVESIVNKQGLRTFNLQNVSKLELPTKFSRCYEEQECFTSYKGTYIDMLAESYLKSYTSVKKIILDMLDMLDIIEDENEGMNLLIKGLLLHIVDELDRNVRNHSGLDSNSVMGYSFAYFKNKKRMNFTIYDEGVGFLESMKSNPVSIYYEGENLLEKCLEKEVSSYSNWKFCDESNKNSGYGLYILSELVKRCSGFLLISSNGKMHIKNFVAESGVKTAINKNLEAYNTLKSNMNSHTLVYFDLDVDKLTSEDVEDFLQKEISGNVSASSRSKNYYFYPEKTKN